MLYEYRAWRFLWREVTYKLETGESVKRQDADTFVIITTDEVLVRAML